MVVGQMRNWSADLDGIWVTWLASKQVYHGKIWHTGLWMNNVTRVVFYFLYKQFYIQFSIHLSCKSFEVLYPEKSPK
ncbi:hypothetical protein HanRHA438_Chr12g0554891 [Helianthus annuus]|nr:hypothetical protein HanRHA438_Chr12g0554891 [Helianthus annuus]